MNVDLTAELTHEKPTVERDAGSGSCRHSSALQGAVVSKPQRVITNPRVKDVALFSPIPAVLLGCVRLLCYVFDPRVSN